MYRVELVKKLNKGIDIEGLDNEEREFVDFLEKERFLVRREKIICRACNKEFNSFDLNGLLDKDGMLYCNGCRSNAISKEDGYDIYLKPTTFQMMLYLIEELEMEARDASRVVINGITNRVLPERYIYGAFKNNMELVEKEAYLQLGCSVCLEEERIRDLSSEQVDVILRLSKVANSERFSDENWINYYNIFDDGASFTCNNCYTDYDDIEGLLKGITSNSLYSSNILSIEYDYKLNIDALLCKSESFLSNCRKANQK